ncbi:hypothetical protein Btru_070197 [Bulinus truncatus]|nr:hypothetical protein Btru_070197 [Bulinus truncatus]
MSAVASPQMHPLASEVQTPRYHLPDGGGVEDPCIAGGSIEKLNPKQMSDSPRPTPRHKKLSRQSAMLLNVSETEDGGSQDRLNAIVQSNQTEQRSNKGDDFTTVREQPVSTAGQQRSEKPVAKPRTKHRLLAEDSRRKTEATFEVFNPVLQNDQLKSSAGEISVPENSTPNVDLSEFDPLKRPTLYFELLNIIAPERRADWGETFHPNEHNVTQSSETLTVQTVDSTIQRMSETGVLTFSDNLFSFDSTFSDVFDPFLHTGFDAICQSFNSALDDDKTSGSGQESISLDSQDSENISLDSSTGEENKRQSLVQQNNGLVDDLKSVEGHSGISQIPQRSGYLYKQGGHNSNRGWRKRWVVFNGTNLRYYIDVCSPVSIRIIPLKCMVKVDVDIRPNDKDSFRFKLHTNIKNRVFLFSSETADDCIKWALTLGAAITQCQKYGWFQEDAEKPDKKGFVRINSKKYFSTVMSQKLTYYDTLEDFEMGSPRHEIELKLASFKIVDPKKFKLKLSTHKTFFDLTFEDQDDMQQWTSALADAIASSLSDDAVLKRVRANESNSWCADCGSERAYWASVNLGIVLCENCAGVHRTFNLKQSKVRSLRMDITVWTPSLVDLMTHIGNANANAFWEHSLPPGAKIIPSSTTKERRAFLNDKYIAKKFCDRTEDKVSESSYIVAMSGSTDVLGVMKLLFTREDASQEGISAAYEAAKRNERTLVSEFLFQNGGDRQQLENTYNEKLEEIRLKGYLQKTGPRGRHFEKRWCVLSHGALMYYTNDKESKCKGLIQRNDMLMVRVKDPGSHQFDVSTKFKDARIYTFSSEDKEGAYKWMQVLTKALVAANAWDQIDMKCVRLAGMGFVKDAVEGEWLECFLVVNHNTLYTVRGNHDVLSVELNKVVGCACSGAGQDKFIFLNTLEKTFQVKAKLARDTEKMFETLDYLVPNPYFVGVNCTAILIVSYICLALMAVVLRRKLKLEHWLLKICSVEHRVLLLRSSRDLTNNYLSRNILFHRHFILSAYSLNIYKRLLSLFLPQNKNDTSVKDASHKDNLNRCDEGSELKVFSYLPKPPGKIPPLDVAHSQADSFPFYNANQFNTVPEISENRVLERNQYDLNNYHDEILKKNELFLKGFPLALDKMSKNALYPDKLMSQNDILDCLIRLKEYGIQRVFSLFLISRVHLEIKYEDDIVLDSRVIKFGKRKLLCFKQVQSYLELCKLLETPDLDINGLLESLAIIGIYDDIHTVLKKARLLVSVGATAKDILNNLLLFQGYEFFYEKIELYKATQMQASVPFFPVKLFMARKIREFKEQLAIDFTLKEIAALLDVKPVDVQACWGSWALNSKLKYKVQMCLKAGISKQDIFNNLKMLDGLPVEKCHAATLCFEASGLPVSVYLLQEMEKTLEMNGVKNKILETNEQNETPDWTGSTADTLPVLKTVSQDKIKKSYTCSKKLRRQIISLVSRKLNMQSGVATKIFNCNIDVTTIDLQDVSKNFEFLCSLGFTREQITTCPFILVHPTEKLMKVSKNMRERILAQLHSCSGLLAEISPYQKECTSNDDHIADFLLLNPTRHLNTLQYFLEKENTFSLVSQKY